MGELNINIDNKSNCDDNITLYILIRCKNCKVHFKFIWGGEKWHYFIWKINIHNKNDIVLQYLVHLWYKYLKNNIIKKISSNIKNNIQTSTIQ